jgi:hypothetical protein
MCGVSNFRANVPKQRKEAMSSELMRMKKAQRGCECKGQSERVRVRRVRVIRFQSAVKCTHQICSRKLEGASERGRGQRAREAEGGER